MGHLLLVRPLLPFQFYILFEKLLRIKVLLVNTTKEIVKTTFLSINV
jgi:hypothetical protein